MAALGYPMGNIATTGAPFDVLGDYFRGARGVLTDMRRRGDKLLEACDKMRRLLVSQVVPAAKASGNPVVFIPLHSATDAFMSQDQVQDLLVAFLRQMMLDLIAEGLIVHVGIGLHQAAGDHQGHTGRQGDLLVRARRHRQGARGSGDVVALRGNVSPSTLTTGTPDDVDAAVKYLVDNIWNKGGRIILDAGLRPSRRDAGREHARDVPGGAKISRAGIAGRDARLRRAEGDRLVEPTGLTDARRRFRAEAIALARAEGLGRAEMTLCGRPARTPAGDGDIGAGGERFLRAHVAWTRAN